MLTQVTTNSMSRNSSCRKRKFSETSSSSSTTSSSSTSEMEKGANYKKFRKKEKIQPPTKSKSLTISPTCKQNDNSGDSLTP